MDGEDKDFPDKSEELLRLTKIRQIVNDSIKTLSKRIKTAD